MLCVACKDLGIESCAFLAEADKPRKVEAKLLDLMRDQDPGMVAGITFEESTSGWKSASSRPFTTWHRAPRTPTGRTVSA